MPSVEERYAAAVAYVRRAVATVEARGVSYAVDPITGLVEWYAGRTKTQPARNELDHLESRWLRTTHDIERARIARDAEELADRVQESLPGAPQDRRRTNLYKDEQQTSTPATNYFDEVATQAHDVYRVLGDTAGNASNAFASIGKWLLAGGAVILGWKVVDYLRERSRRSEVRSADTVQNSLNANLERTASQRDARGSQTYSVRLTRGELEALQFLRGRYESADLFFDGLIPLDESADDALSMQYVSGKGPYRFQIRSVDVRRAIQAIKGDGGNYGSIPNLRSESIDWVLAEERSRAR